MSRACVAAASSTVKDHASTVARPGSSGSPPSCVIGYGARCPSQICLLLQQTPLEVAGAGCLDGRIDQTFATGTVAHESEPQVSLMAASRQAPLDRCKLIRYRLKDFQNRLLHDTSSFQSQKLHVTSFPRTQPISAIKKKAAPKSRNERRLGSKREQTTPGIRWSPNRLLILPLKAYHFGEEGSKNRRLFSSVSAVRFEENSEAGCAAEPFMLMSSMATVPSWLRRHPVRCTVLCMDIWILIRPEALSLKGLHCVMCKGRLVRLSRRRHG